MSRCNEIGKYVKDAGGTGNNLTSIYMITVGPDLFHLLYPKGSSSCGIEREDLGRVHIEDPENKGKISMKRLVFLLIMAALLIGVMPALGAARPPGDVFIAAALPGYGADSPAVNPDTVPVMALIAEMPTGLQAYRYNKLAVSTINMPRGLLTKPA